MCADSGDAMFVRALGTGRVFFACPLCGIAWVTPPQPCVVDTIDEPTVFAPGGYTVAGEDEIKAAGLWHLVRIQYPGAEADRFEGNPGFQRVRT